MSTTDEIVVRAIIRDELSKGLDHIGDRVRRLDKDVRAAHTGVQRLGGGMNTTSQQVRKLDGHLKTASASLGHLSAQATRTATISLGTLGVAATGFGLKSAAGFQTSRIAFGTLLGSVERGNALFTQLQNFNLQTPFNLQQISSATQTLLQFGFTGENVMTTLKGISDIAANTDNPGENLNRIALALGQIQGAGVLRAQDLNQLVQAGFPAYQLLQQITGQTAAQIRKQMESGLTIPADKFIQAVQGQTGMLAKYAGGAAAQAKTLSGVWSNFTDRIQVRLSTAFQPLADALSVQLPVFTDTLGRFIDSIAPPLAAIGIMLLSAANTFLPLVAPVIKALLEGIGALLSAMAPALVQLQPVMGELAGAITQMVGDLLPHMPELVDAFVALVALLPQMVGILAGLIPLLSPLVSLVGTLAGMRGAAAGLLAVLLGYRVLSSIAGGVFKMALALQALNAVQGGGGGAAGGAGLPGVLGRGAGVVGKLGAGLGIAGGVLGVGVSAMDAYQNGAGAGNLLGGAASGAVVGASLGSIVPGLGTVIGGVGGALLGFSAAGISSLAGGDSEHGIPKSMIWDPSKPGYGGYGGSVDNSLSVGAINVINPTSDVDVQRAIEAYQRDRTVRK